MTREAPAQFETESLKASVILSLFVSGATLRPIKHNEQSVSRENR